MSKEAREVARARTGLHRVVSRHVAAGNEGQVFCKSIKCSYHWAISYIYFKFCFLGFLKAYFICLSVHLLMWVQCHGGQRGTLDSLDLELHMVVSCHVDVRTQTRVLCIITLGKEGRVGILGDKRTTWEVDFIPQWSRDETQPSHWLLALRLAHIVQTSLEFIM